MKKLTETQHGSRALRAADLHFVLSWLLVNGVLRVSAAPPSINYQPQSQAVILYQQAAFGVIARGTPPLSYQWRKDGVHIAGATSDQILLAQPQFSDAGRYSVLVSNAEGSVNSAEAALVVNAPKGGDLDYSFAWGGSISGGFMSGVIRSSVVQPDGKVLIAGNFSTVHGAVRGGIARLNADGTTDYSFMNGLSGTGGTVFSVAVQGDGKVLIGGRFSTVNGVSRNSIARLNADGTLDSGFLKGLSGVGGSVYQSVNSIALQSDAKVLIGGGFLTVNGMSRSGIARLNADGTLDSGFQTEVSFGANGQFVVRVQSIVVQSDGEVLIGGEFSRVNGVSRNGIARLNADGSMDSGFQNGLPGTDCCVYSIAVQSDGKVLSGGWSRNGIARLNADGTLDSGFQTEIFGPAKVRSVAVQSDGKVLIGGWFTIVNGVSRNHIARLNADGSVDRGFENAVSGIRGFDPFNDGVSVVSVAVQDDGKALIGGNFSTVDGINRPGIARLKMEGTLDTAFQPGLGGVWASVSAVALQNDGKVIIGRDNVNLNIARFNVDGTLDSSFLNGLAGVGGVVSSVAVALQNDGKVIIGGSFTTVNGVSNGIARLNADGTLDSGFLSGLGGANGQVASLAVQSDGKVIIGGNFTKINDVSRGGIARLNTDGTLDSGFLNGLSGISDQSLFAFPRVDSIAVQSDGKVIIGGSFTKVNGVSRTNIARLNVDGTLDSSFLNGLAGVGAGVSSVALQNDGKIIIGGYFTAVNGESRYNLAQLAALGQRRHSAAHPEHHPERHRRNSELGCAAESNLSRAIQGQSLRQHLDRFGRRSFRFTPIGTASKTDGAFGNAGQRFYRVMLLP